MLIEEMKGDFIKVEPTAEAILTRRINELAHNVGMSRQHKKLITDLRVELSQKCYHEGYDDGMKDNRIGPDYNDGHDFWTKKKENSE